MNYRIILLIFLFAGCIPSEPLENNVVEGYVPIYGSTTTKEIKLLGSRPVNNPGKIYTYNHFLLINEANRGIHIFDNSNPELPNPIGFIEVIGNTDMAIRNNILYADHMGSLAALKSDNFSAIDQVGRLPISNWLLGVPPPSQNYFECIQPELGFVIGWKKQSLTNPACYAF